MHEISFKTVYENTYINNTQVITCNNNLFAIVCRYFHQLFAIIYKSTFFNWNITSNYWFICKVNKKGNFSR